MIDWMSLVPFQSAQTLQTLQQQSLGLSYNPARFSWENFRTFSSATPDFVNKIMTNPVLMPPAMKAALDAEWKIRPDMGGPDDGTGIKSHLDQGIQAVASKFGGAAAMAYAKAWNGQALEKSDPLGWAVQMGYMTQADIDAAGGTGSTTSAPQAMPEPIQYVTTRPEDMTKAQAASTVLTEGNGQRVYEAFSPDYLHWLGYTPPKNPISRPETLNNVAYTPPPLGNQGGATQP